MIKVQDVGKDLAPMAFVEAVQKSELEAIGMPPLSTATLRVREYVIRALRKAGPGAQGHVGAAPVSRAFGDQIGAEGCASSAAGSRSGQTIRRRHREPMRFRQKGGSLHEDKLSD